MIDLKKPLEGGPGLLLMATLIFYGAVLGVVAALFFKWVKLEPDMANFLGGVMGAALGASGAVLGAVYIQHREWRAAQVAPTRQARKVLRALSGHVEDAHHAFYCCDPHHEKMAPLMGEWSPELDKALDKVEREVRRLSLTEALSAEMYDDVNDLAETLDELIAPTREYSKQCLELFNGKRQWVFARRDELDAKWTAVSILLNATYKRLLAFS